MNATDLLILWTARIAVGCCLARWWIDWRHGREERSQRASRLWWTIGCGIFLLHVAAAFEWRHGWSHTAALEHTRRQTQLLTGWDSGAGLWLNYLMTALWTFDVIAWQRSLDWPRQRWFAWPIQAFLAFITINATVVFGHRGWWAVVVVVIVIVAWKRRLAR